MIGVLVCFAFTLVFILVLGPLFDAHRGRDRRAIDPRVTDGYRRRPRQLHGGRRVLR